jgi:hypothetical protein
MSENAVQYPWEGHGAPITIDEATSPQAVVGAAEAVARKFIALGGHVIFFPRGTKRCTENKWQFRATNDISSALEWISEVGPEANVGIVGKRDGLWALDDDSGLLNEYESEYGPMNTCTTQTVSGGKHYIFRQNADSWAMGNITVNDEQGKELLSARVNDRYVVAPGSWAHPHNDEKQPLAQYLALNPNSAITEAPRALLEFIMSRASGTSARKKSLRTTGKHISQGGRNNHLASVAGRLRWAGLSKESVLRELSIVNERDCTPPLLKREVESIASSISKHPAGGTEVIQPEIISNVEPDMSQAVLDGWLGEICSKYMDDFPVAYAWPSLLTVASALAPKLEDPVNIFGCLVGDTGTGKSQAINRAISLLGLNENDPVLLNMCAGSAEGLLADTGISEAKGDRRLYNPDELGHLLQKATIEHSSFPFLLNTIFYKSKFELKMAHGKSASVNCRLSLIGGLVEDRFDDLFGASTTGGLYDRFIFGRCPATRQFYFTNRRVPQVLSASIDRPKIASAHPDVYEALRDWRDTRFGGSRVTELAFRVALICASFDNRKELRAEELGPALEFAKYQFNFRQAFSPNAGQNADGKLAHKFLKKLASIYPSWIGERELFKATRAYDLGPSAARRALDSLIFAGEVKPHRIEKKRLVRLANGQ